MFESNTKLVVLISGNGSNLQAIIDAIDSGKLSATICHVISNRKEAFGLQRAENAGIDSSYFPLKPYINDGRGRIAYDLDLADIINQMQPDLIVLAGLMHVLSAEFLGRISAKVINLHPALPGQFAGTHAIERAYEAFQVGEIKHSGCMVHEVIPEVDAGSVIVQAQVALYADDTLEQFEQRMHETEHRILVDAISQLRQHK